MRPLLAWLLLTAACSSGDDDGVVDASIEDAGFAPDALPRGLCPLIDMPACTEAAGCGQVNAPQSNCGGCYSYSPTMGGGICTFGACETPARHPKLHIVSFAVGALEPNLRSFASAGVMVETTGGDTIGCDDVYAGDVDFTNPCYNVVDSRGLADIAMVGQTYPFPFNGLPDGKKTLLIIWGYGLEESQGDPIGISCTALDVGTGGVDCMQNRCVEGDMMRPIQ
jgi:hypothetical protein